MKYFDNESGILEILKALCIVILLLSFQLLLGSLSMTGALYTMAFILDAEWLLQITQIPFGQMDIIEFRVNFNYWVFLVCITVSLIVYGILMYFLKKFHI